jgi:phosphonatase-like hydrolase
MAVFDMAGTTVNEDNVVYKTLQKAINKNGFNFSLEQVIAAGAGKEKLQAIKSILKQYGDREDNTVSALIYQHFVILLNEEYKHLHIFPQPNAVNLFEILRKKKIIVILNTGYNSETAQNLIKKLGWSEGIEFDCLITSSDVKNNRPDPDMILLAMKKFGIEHADEVVKVGDSTIDIEEGRNAGCALNIGITTGAHNFQQLQTANPDYIISDLLELVPILSTMA